MNPKYVALLAKRFVLTQPVLGVYNLPRGSMLMSERSAAHSPQKRCPQPTDCPDVDEPAVELPSPLPEEISLVSVEIRDAADRRLVTVIEIFSPVNKHSDGVRVYRRRRTALLRTSIHLLEIDLLRHGERIELIGEPPPAPYYVYLSRVQRRPYTQVWPIALRQSLPVVPVPLLPPDMDIPLDLQSAVRVCYDLDGYDRMLDYSTPLPNLSDEDAIWVDGILQTVGYK
jgi:hypothetical protein